MIRVSILAALLLLAGCERHESARTRDTRREADLVVTAAGPTAPVASGQSAEFHIRVTNAGPHDAADVRIINTIGAQSELVSMTCNAEGPAICPNPIAQSMLVPTLPNGGVLTFTVTLKLANRATGIIVDAMAANFAGDFDPNNNSVAVDAVVR